MAFLLASKNRKTRKINNIQRCQKLTKLLFFYPVMMGYHLGQLQVWINMLFALACLAWIGNRQVLAGVLIGLVCLLKPQFGLFVLWALLRKEWRFLFAMCVTGAVGLLVSVILFGFKNHLEYISVLQFLSRHGESYWANQSLNGLLHRLAGNGIGEWVAGEFPPFSPVIYTGTLFATIAILAFALMTRRGPTPTASLFDFMLAALAFTAASPIAWEHHYGVLAPMIAALFAISLMRASGGQERYQTLALALCVIFIANCFVMTRELTAAPFNIAQSYLYFAALGVLALLRLRAKEGAPIAARTA